MVQKLKTLEGEVTALRAMNDQLLSENAQLCQLVEAQEKRMTEFAESPEMKEKSREDLMEQVVFLTERLQTETVLRRDMMTRYRRAQRKVAKKELLKRNFLELQQAHKEQSLFLQALQEENSKIPLFEEAARKQEKIINRLARLLHVAVDKKKEKYDMVSDQDDPDSEVEASIRTVLEELSVPRMQRSSPLMAGRVLAGTPAPSTIPAITTSPAPSPAQAAAQASLPTGSPLIAAAAGGSLAASQGKSPGKGAPLKTSSQLLLAVRKIEHEKTASPPIRAQQPPQPASTFALHEPSQQQQQPPPQQQPK